MIPASCIIIHPATLRSFSIVLGTPSSVDGVDMSCEVDASGCGRCGFIVPLGRGYCYYAVNVCLSAALAALGSRHHLIGINSN